MICGEIVVSTTQPLISCICRAVSQLQCYMVNNRNVLTLNRLLNHLLRHLLLFSDLDINLSPSGNIVKRAGEALNLSLQIDSSEEAKVFWTKVEAIFYITKLQSFRLVPVVDSADILLIYFRIMLN